MLMHSGTITLETQSLILRRFSMDDAPSLYRDWSDPAVMVYLWKPMTALSQAYTRIEKWM